MQVETWPLSRVKPYDRNPRRNEPAVAAVARSIELFGFRQPIVVDRDGVIIAGHTRYKAALKLGVGEHLRRIRPNREVRITAPRAEGGE